MAKPSIVDVRKPRGRPPIGAVPVTVRVPPALLAQIDQWAAKHGTGRPEAMRAMIEALIALGGLDER